MTVANKTRKVVIPHIWENDESGMLKSTIPYRSSYGKLQQLPSFVKRVSCRKHSITLYADAVPEASMEGLVFVKD